MKAKLSWLAPKTRWFTRTVNLRDLKPSETSDDLRSGHRIVGGVLAWLLVGVSCLWIVSKSMAVGTDWVPVPLGGPVIDKAPTAQQVVEGQSATFLVQATGLDLYYQWQRDDRILLGETNATLSLKSIQPAQAGLYSVRVFNEIAEVVTTPAKLEVLPLPSLSAPLASLIVTQGATARFEATAQGVPPILFQWFKDNAPLPGATESVLTLTAVQPDQAGRYQLQLTDRNGVRRTDPAELQVLVPAHFVQALRPAVAFLGARFVWSAPAEGTPPLTYEWRRNGQPIPGAQEATLVFDPASDSDAGEYSVRVQNAAGFDTSAVVEFQVWSRPRILDQPKDVRIALGETLKLNAAAEGSDPLIFFWRFNGVDLFGDPRVSGESTANLVIPQITPDFTGEFLLIACNYAGLVASRPIHVDVQQPPSILQPPQSQSVQMFEDLTLSVQATGSAPLRYQWRHNGANIPDGTNAVLGPLFVQQDAGGMYSVVVENDVGVATSESAFVIVQNTLVAPADSFAEATSLNLQIGCTILKSSTAGLTREPGEPLHAGSRGGASGWYRWTAPLNAHVTLDTAGSGFDTLLAVYVGNEVSHLTRVASSEDSGGHLTSRLEFVGLQGTEYWIAIDGFDGEQGDLSLTLILQPTPYTQMPRIVTSPESGSGLAGRSVHLVVSATGPNLVYQWYFLGQPLALQTHADLLLPDVQARDVGEYFVRVKDAVSGFFVDSDRAFIEIGPAESVISQDKRYLSPSGSEGRAVVLSDIPTTAGTIILRPGATTGQILNTFSSTISASDPSTCQWTGGGSRWITNIVVEKKGVVLIDTQGSSVPALTGLFSYVSARPQLVACSQNGLIVFTNQIEGGVYDLMADTVQGLPGIVSIQMALVQIPELALGSIQEVSLDLNQSVVLDAGISNNPLPAPAIQWYLDGTNALPAATNRTFNLIGFQPALAGRYTVRIHTLLGDLTNEVARLSAKYPPAWTLEAGVPSEVSATRSSVWARSGTEAYFLENRSGLGTAGGTEARVFRSIGREWEMVLRMPGFVAQGIVGARSADLNVLFSRVDTAPSTAWLLQSTNRGSTWLTNPVPELKGSPKATALAASSNTVQILRTDGSVQRWKSGAWSTLTASGSGPLIAFQLIDDQFGYGVGARAIWKWDGTKWAEIGSAPASFEARSLAVLGNGTSASVLVLGRDSQLLRARVWQAVPQSTNPGSFTAIESLLPNLTDSSVRGIWGSSLSNVFLLSSRAESEIGLDRARIDAFDGQRWTELNLGLLPSAVTLSGALTDEVWIPLSDGRMLHRHTAFPPLPPSVHVTSSDPNWVEGSDATFVGTLLGTVPQSLAWEKNGKPFPGATDLQLRIDPLSEDSLGVYVLNASNAFGTASGSFTMSVLKRLPGIQSQPASQSLYAGSSLTLSVVGQGEPPLGYQWFSTSGPVAGQTSSEFRLDGIRVQDAGEYWVEVSNPYGKIVSQRASVTVIPGWHLSALTSVAPPQFQGTADQPYVVERSRDLIQWSPWFTNRVLRFSAPFQFQDVETLAEPYLFYRVREWPVAP